MVTIQYLKDKLRCYCNVGNYRKHFIFLFITFCFFGHLFVLLMKYLQYETKVNVTVEKDENKIVTLSGITLCGETNVENYVCKRSQEMMKKEYEKLVSS